MDKKIPRRRFVQGIGASLSGISALGGVASASRDRSVSNKDSKFNPNKSEEVREFVKTYKPLDNPETADRLTKEQQEAVLDFYTDIEWEYEISTDAAISTNKADSSETDVDIALSASANPGYAHITAYGSTGVTREYTFNANFSWKWRGRGNGYHSVSSNSNGHSNAVAGRYKSNSRTHGKTTVWDSYFHAYETGQFQLHFGASYRTVTAKIKIRGDEAGKHNVLNKRAPL